MQEIPASLCSIPGSGRFPGEGIGYPLQYSWASLVAQLVKDPPAMWETWVRFLGWEDPLEKEMATHNSILAWRIPWTEEPGGLQSMGLQRVRRDWAANIFTFHYYLQSQVDRAPLVQLWTGYILIPCMCTCVHVYDGAMCLLFISSTYCKSMTGLCHVHWCLMNNWMKK